MAADDLFLQHWNRMHIDVRQAIAQLCDNSGFGFPVRSEETVQRFCELLAIAARLGELSLNPRTKEV